MTTADSGCCPSYQQGPWARSLVPGLLALLSREAAHLGPSSAVGGGSQCAGLPAGLRLGTRRWAGQEPLCSVVL